MMMGVVTREEPCDNSFLCNRKFRLYHTKMLRRKRTVENSKNGIYNVHKKKKRFENNQQNILWI